MFCVLRVILYQAPPKTASLSYLVTARCEDLNPLQVPHGGVYFALADTACGSAMAAYGTMAVTISCSFSFLKSAQAGDKPSERTLPSSRRRFSSRIMALRSVAM